MDTLLKIKQKGIASLFDQEELKKFFKNYLILIAIAETFVFFVSFITQLGPDNTPFPWESYFFAAFIIPIAITFLLGVCIMGFNTYLFGEETEEVDPAASTAEGLAVSSGFLTKLNFFLYSVRQIPALLGLGLLGLSASMFYKLDDILILIGHAGEKTAQYLLISLCAILAAASLFGLVWLLLNYRLKRKEMEYRFRFKKEVVAHTGLVILDDNSVMDREGKMLAAPGTPALGPGPAASETPTLLPAFKARGDKKEKEGESLSR